MRLKAVLSATVKALQFTPHLALLLLLLAIALHVFGWPDLAEIVGDVTFFVLVIAVIFRRDRATESP